MQLTKDQIVDSLRGFTSRRDNLLHEDIAAFDHHLQRFLDFCESDALTRSVLSQVEAKWAGDLNEWWAAATSDEPKLAFPSDPAEELALRYQIIKSARENPQHILVLAIAQQHKSDGSEDLFRTLVVRPFVEELTHRIGEAANLATPEARDVQAVPLNRIPGSNEVKIFLSHKSIDTPLVNRYYSCLKAIGFDPWLDEPNMPAGSNLERELLRGLEESCAAVFFITNNFLDERYLATEVEYAVLQKRKKGKKFAIITLRYSGASPVPGLLNPYVYKDITNDLEGFRELLKALPIEMGPIRWRADVI